MKVLKKILIIIIVLFLVLLLSFNLYNFVCIKILKQDLATINGYAILEVVSGSMEPTIHVGDMIVIDTKEKEFKEDDIITFYDENKAFVTHRIIKMLEDDQVITKGDNKNNSEDEPIATSSIVGKYLFKIDGAGIIMTSLKSPFTMGMILICGLLICILVSTDRHGNPILEGDEKEFQEYLNSKKENEKKMVSVKEESSETPSKKKTGTTKKTTTKKKATESKETTKPKKETDSKSKTTKTNSKTKTSTSSKKTSSTPKKTSKVKVEAKKVSPVASTKSKNTKTVPKTKDSKTSTKTKTKEAKKKVSNTTKKETKTVNKKSTTKTKKETSVTPEKKKTTTKKTTSSKKK